VRYDCWLGSSASNLYRTKLLQTHPFPTHVGHFGDTLFALEQAWRIKAVFCRRRCGSFIVHHHTSLQAPEDRKRLFEGFDGPWKESFARVAQGAQLSGAAERMVAFLLEDLTRSGDAIERLRDKLWIEGQKKAKLRDELEQRKEQASGKKPPAWTRSLRKLLGFPSP
jgi:hypothetical protein